MYVFFLFFFFSFDATILVNKDVYIMHRLFRGGKGVYDESSGQRISRDNEQGGQRTSVYDLVKGGELHYNGVVNRR